MRPPRLHALLLAAPLAAAAAIILLSVLYTAAWAGPRGLASALGDGVARAVYLSLATATASTVISLALALPSAYVLSRGLVPSPRLLETLLMVPFAMPPVAVGLSALLLLTGPAAWVEKLLNIVFTPKGLVAAQTAIAYPIALRVLRSALDSVPPRLEAVARSLGCSWWCSFTHIVLPMASRGVAAAAALSFLRSLGEFGASAVLAGVKPDTATIPIAIYLAFSGGEPATAAALATISAVAAIVGAYILNYLEGGGKR